MSGLRTQRQDLRPFERAFPLSKYGKVGSKSTFQRWRPLAPGRKQSARQLRSTEHRVLHRPAAKRCLPYARCVAHATHLARIDASVDSERGDTGTWQMHAWRSRDPHHPRLYDTLSVSTCLTGFPLRNQFAMLCVITRYLFISMARMYCGTVRMRKAAVSAAE